MTTERGAVRMLTGSAQRTGIDDGAVQPPRVHIGVALNSRCTRPSIWMFP